MKPVAPIPCEDFARKPPYGSPCNRCGVCCMATRCDLGEHLFGVGGHCPALERDGDGYRCGVVADPAAYSVRTAIYGADKMRKAAKQIIYAGEGCDSRFNGEPINKKFHAECEVRNRRNFNKRKAALELWGIR